MRVPRQQRLVEYNATVTELEELLYDAECTVASLRHVAPPEAPPPHYYRNEKRVVERLAQIKERLEELAAEKAQLLALQYRVPENAGSLVRCLNTRLE